MMDYQISQIILIIIGIVLLLVIGYLTWLMRIALINLGLLKSKQKIIAIACISFFPLIYLIGSSIVKYFG